MNQKHFIWCETECNEAKNRWLSWRRIDKKFGLFMKT